MANSLNYRIIVGASDQASSKLDKIGRRAGDLGRKAAQLTGAFAAAGGAALAFASQQVSVIDGMAKAAKAAGVSAESLQELRFAAERSGASAQQLDEGLRRMNRRIGLAADGAGPAAATLDKMGISVRDASGNVKSTESVLDEFIGKVGEMGSQAEIAAAASAILGDDAGPKLALLLAEGASGVASLREEARTLGVVSNESASQAEATADAFTNFEQSTTALGQSLAVKLFPTLEKIARFLTTAIPRGIDLANAGILKMRKIWLDVISLIIGKVRDVVGVLADLERASARTQIALGRDFNEVETPLADLERKLSGVHEIIEDMADTTETEFREAVSGATGDVEAFTGATQPAEVAVGDFGSASDTAAGQVSNLKRELSLVEQLFPAVKAQVTPTTDEVEAFWTEVEAAADVARVQASPALAGLLGDFEGLAGGVESTGEEYETFGVTVVDTTQEMIDGVAAFANAFAAVVSGIDEDAARVVQSIANIAASWEAATEAQRSGGFVDNALAGFAIGGNVGAAAGFGPTGQFASSIGGGLGQLLGGFFGAGPIGAVLGAAGLGSLFEDFGETNTRIALNLGQARSASDSGADPRFFRNTNLGFSVAGQQITEATDAVPIIDGVVTLINGLGEIGRLSGQASNQSIAESLGVFEAGGSIIGPFVNASPEEVFQNVLGRALGGFSQSVQNLVGPVTTVEETFKRLELAVQFLEALDVSPLEQYAEAVRVSNLTLVEGFQEQSAALIDQVEAYDGSTTALERITQGTVGFNQAIVQTLLALDQASDQVAAITASTIENLEFRALGESEGEGAQIDFLIRRAQTLTSEIGGLGSADEITRQIQLINSLISQASSLIPEGTTAGFLEDVRPILEQAERDAQQRIAQIRTDIEQLADATAEAIRTAIEAPAQQISSGAQAIQQGSSNIADAAGRFESGTQNFIVGVSQIPTVIEVQLLTTEINAA